MRLLCDIIIIFLKKNLFKIPYQAFTEDLKTITLKPQKKKNEL